MTYGIFSEKRRIRYMENTNRFDQMKRKVTNLSETINEFLCIDDSSKKWLPARIDTTLWRVIGTSLQSLFG
ncbi:hypothetical protein HZH66_004955 [Vespula vulgaris]|uniref:Uncharacterized protein n=1 Tax=Vespula vulgaris TaxID=7454 RepID=A0A834K9R8_VESVU|nr:hypothetical protein HZH66_004955 [Vespula vulgaris]